MTRRSSSAIQAVFSHKHWFSIEKEPNKLRCVRIQAGAGEKLPRQAAACRTGPMEEDVLLALANLGYWQPVAAKPWRPGQEWRGAFETMRGSGGLSQIPNEAQIRRLTTAA